MKKLEKTLNIVAAKSYEYKGEKKTEWVRLGKQLVFDDGSKMSIIDCIPVGNWFDGILHFFENKQKEEPITQPQAKQVEPLNLNRTDDDLPF